jgi:hypothetical protein
LGAVLKTREGRFVAHPLTVQMWNVEAATNDALDGAVVVQLCLERRMWSKRRLFVG